ncbi:MAG: mechanosensitive ion channel family protein [Kofleriaceae bacterium]
MLETLRELASSPIAITIAALVGAYLIARIVTRVLSAIAARVVRRTQSTWDDRLVERLGGPFSLLIGLQLFRAALGWIELAPRATGLIERTCGTAMIAIVVWAGFRMVDLSRSVLQSRSWAREQPSSRSLIALAARFAQVAVLVFGVIVALSQLGVSVASLIAGLGIGGLVFALAAQKTVENLFGAVSIGIDQPLREGDFVKVYDFVGTVEKIGLRSTRIRTLDRTIITIPNGELSNQRIESYTARDRMRLATVIGLEYGTTADQIRTIVAQLEAILRRHPKIWPDAVVVRFKEFAASSLDIEIMAWFQTQNTPEFQAIRQDILIAFMDAITAAGAGIAFPTRTVHLVSEPAQPS